MRFSITVFRATCSRIVAAGVLAAVTGGAAAQDRISTTDFAARKLPTPAVTPGDLPRPCPPMKELLKKRPPEIQYSTPAAKNRVSGDPFLGATLRNWARRHFGYAQDLCVEADFVVRKFQEATGAPVTGTLTDADVDRLAQALDAGRKAFGRAQPEAPTQGGTAPDIKGGPSVFGIPLGQPFRMPVCPVNLDPTMTRLPEFVVATCHSRIGRGDPTDPNAILTYQVYLSRDEHPAWMSRIGQSVVGDLPAPSLLLDIRDSAVTGVRFEGKSEVRGITLDALTRKYGPPASLSADGRIARWSVEGVTATAFCTSPPPPEEAIIYTPKCTYSVRLDSEMARQAQQREQQDNEQRKQMLDSGRKL